VEDVVVAYLRTYSGIRLEKLNKTTETRARGDGISARLEPNAPNAMQLPSVADVLVRKKV
jgi:hypothetical protein